MSIAWTFVYLLDLKDIIIDKEKFALHMVYGST